LWRRDFLYFRATHDLLDLFNLLFCYSLSLAHWTHCNLCSLEWLLILRRTHAVLQCYVLWRFQQNNVVLFCKIACEATFTASWETSTWPSRYTGMDDWLSKFPHIDFIPFYLRISCCLLTKIGLSNKMGYERFLSKKWDRGWKKERKTWFYKLEEATFRI
jgi:hypothetical protein